MIMPIKLQDQVNSNMASSYRKSISLSWEVEEKLRERGDLTNNSSTQRRCLPMFFGEILAKLLLNIPYSEMMLGRVTKLNIRIKIIKFSRTRKRRKEK